MKSKLLKILAVLGITGVLAISGTASASSCGYDSEYNSEESGEKVGLQCHTYHAAESPFIW